jgi:hypothetical protein
VETTGRPRGAEPRDSLEESEDFDSACFQGSYEYEKQAIRTILGPWLMDLKGEEGWR